jgi:hypothetical protein
MEIVPGNILELSWPTIAGRSYRLLTSTDATNWTPATDWFRATAAEATHNLPLTAADTAFLKIEVRP